MINRMKYLKLLMLLLLISNYTGSAREHNKEHALFVNVSTKMINTIKLDYGGTLKNDVKSDGSFTENKRILPEGSIFITILGYFGIFSIGFLSAMLYFKYKIKNILKVEYHEYKTQIQSSEKKYPSFIFGVIKILKERKNDYKKESENTSCQKNKSIEKTILISSKEENEIPQEQKNHPENDISDFKGQLNDNIIIENAEDIQAVSLNSQEIKVNILYFTIPEENGSFLEDMASLTASATSYYKIEFFEGDRTAKLIYRSGNRDPSAISKMNDILGPVCEIENSSMTNPSRISVESQGTVIKDDDKWIVSDKIKIKLT